MRRRLLRLSLAAYLAALHLLIAVLIVKTNFLLLAGKTLGWIPPEEWNEGLYEKILDQAERDRTVGSGAIVLIGDSIIEQLDARLVSAAAINFGAGGDTTRTLLRRLPTMRSIDSADAVVLGIGVNDFKYRDVPEILVDYERVLRRLGPSRPLVMVSVLPVNERAAEIRGRPYLRNDRIARLNLALRDLCDARVSCRFADVWPAMMNEAEGGLRHALHGSDGWHLSPEGNRMLAQIITTALTPQ